MSVDKFGRRDDFIHRRYMKGLHREIFRLTSEGNYDMNNKILRRLGEPRSGRDAVNLQYFQKNCINKSANGHFNCNGCVINNTGSPLSPSDAATKEYVDNLAIKKTADNNYDFINTCLRNVSDPQQPNDVVTLKFLQRATPTQDVDHWEFHNKRLSNISDPLYAGEAVNLKTLNNSALCKNEDGNFDASNKKIMNLADGELDTDAASVRFVKHQVQEACSELENQLQKLGSALFEYIHKDGKIPPQRNVNNKNYLDWKHIHARRK